MNKLGFLCGSAELSTATSSDYISLNQKLSAEKLVKEQASLKTDLDMATTKLKKSMEHIHSLEEKLQNAINENAKLKVKQKEDSKLWEGSDSKFSSTKTSSDQLAEMLQYLACRVRDAEQDKNQLEDKLSESSKAFDCLDLQMKDLAVKLESAEDNIKKSNAELTELKVQKEEMKRRHTDDSSRAVSLIGGKDALIKDLEGTVAADKLCFQSLNSRLEEVQHELSLKEDICKCLTAIQNDLEKEKSALQLSNDDFAKRLLASGEEIKGLEALVHELVEKLFELDKHEAMVSDNIVQLNHAFDTCYKLVQQEKDLTANRTQIQIARLDNQLLHVTSEKESLQSSNEDLKNKAIELQSSHESFMAQHAEESRLAEEKVQKLESEAEVLVSKKTELELLVSQLEEKIEHLSEASKLSSRRKLKNLPNMKTLLFWFFVEMVVCAIISLAGFDDDSSGATFDIFDSSWPPLGNTLFNKPKPNRNPPQPQQEKKNDGGDQDRFLIPPQLRFLSGKPELRYLVCSLQIKSGRLLFTEKGRRSLRKDNTRAREWSVHGLWPPDGNTDDGPTFDRSKILGDPALLSELKRRWPNLHRESEDLEGHLGFWASEWKKHGSLTGLEQTSYFELALYMHRKLCRHLEEAIVVAKKGRQSLSQDTKLGVEVMTIPASLFDSATSRKADATVKLIWEELDGRNILVEVQFNISLADCVVVDMEMYGNYPRNDELIIA